MSESSCEEDQNGVQNIELHDESLYFLYQDNYEYGPLPPDKMETIIKPKRHKSLVSLESDSLFSGGDLLDSGYNSFEHTLDHDNECIDDCDSGVGTLTRKVS